MEPFDAGATVGEREHAELAAVGDDVAVDVWGLFASPARQTRLRNAYRGVRLKPTRFRPEIAYTMPTMLSTTPVLTIATLPAV